MKKATQIEWLLDKILKDCLNVLQQYGRIFIPFLI